MALTQNLWLREAECAEEEAFVLSMNKHLEWAWGSHLPQDAKAAGSWIDVALFF